MMASLAKADCLVIREPFAACGRDRQPTARSSGSIVKRAFAGPLDLFTSN